MENNTVVEYLQAYFYSSRFGPNHLGLGDIKLTIGQQEEIIEAIKEILSNE